MSTLAWFIGRRYTSMGQRSHMVAFISRVSMVGLSLGVALLIIVLSVMNGFDKEMRERILGLVPQASIIGYQPIKAWRGVMEMAMRHPDVTGAAPYTHLQGLLLKGRNTEAVLVQGILPQAELDSSILAKFVDKKVFSELHGAQVIVGKDLAESLDVSVGDRITLVLPQTGYGHRVTPKLQRLNVVGTIDSGTELDRRIALIHIDMAGSLAEIDGAVQGIRLSVDDLFSALQIAYEIRADLPEEYRVTDWTRTHGNLYSAIQLSKQLVGLLMLIIIAVAAFNVVSTLFLVVKDKQGDIAILRTLGLSPRGVMAVFMVQGTLIGVIGTAIGAVFGVLISLTISDLVRMLEQLLSVQFLSSEVYPVNHLPTDLRLTDVLLVCCVAIVMSFIATVYPAWRATRIQPAEALRYE